MLTGDYSIVDSLKESYGMDITLFYGDKRILTTLTDKKGKRMSGTSADGQVSHWVLENGKDYFSEKIKIGGKSYFAYNEKEKADIIKTDQLWEWRLRVKHVQVLWHSSEIM